MSTENTPVECKQPPGLFAPVVSLTRCEGKGDCEKVCPEKVFEVRRIEDADYQPLGMLQKLKLKVHGIEGLRVGDASIMPTMVASNTNAPSIMIGEKASDLVLADAN